MVLFGLLVLPFAVGGLGYFLLRRTVTWKEYLGYTLISVLVAVAGYAYSTYRAIRDTEVLGGRIAAKIHDRTPCCHCRSVCTRRGDDWSCKRWRSECVHSKDHHWALTIDVGTEKTVELGACDGSGTPPRAWAEATVGQPAAVEHHYLNYLAADEHSLLNSGEIDPEYFDRIPQFPRVRDTFAVDRIIEAGARAPSGWSQALNEIAAKLGPTKEVDPRIVVTDLDDPRFADAVEAKWNYGPKNAVTVVIGVGGPGGSEVQWARAVTMSRVSALQVAIREQLPGMSLRGTAVPERIGSLLDAHFERLPMAQLRYLLGAAHPGATVAVLLYVIDLLVIGGLVWLAHRLDPFGEQPQPLLRRIRSRAARLTWLGLAWRIGRYFLRRFVR